MELLGSGRDGDVNTLPARSLDEAYEYVAIEPCECGRDGVATGAVDVTTESDGRYRLAFACPHCAAARTYEFVLTEPANRPGEEFRYSPGRQPSRIIDAGGWVRVTRRHYEAVQEILGDLGAAGPTDDELVALLVRSLTRAAAAAEEALRFLPDGAAEPPDSAFFTDLGRETRERNPELCGGRLLRIGPVRCRERLTELIRGYQRRTAEPIEALCGEVLPYGTRPAGDPLPARTHQEALAYAKAVPCRCGASDFEPEGSPVVVGGRVLTRFFGACGSCGRPRELLFRNLNDDRSELPASGLWGLDERPSRLFDAGAFMGLAAFLGQTGAGLVATDPAGQWYPARHVLRLAAGAMDEVLKFLPPGAPAVPVEALWYPDSVALYRSQPALFTRDRLVAEREAAWQRVADFLARYPAPSVVEPGRPRSAAERRLYLDIHPCKCGSPVFEPDLPGLVDTPDGPMLKYAGACTQCGRLREFEFALTEEPTADGSFADGDAPSELVDAGQWLLVAESCSRYAEGLDGDAPEFAPIRRWLTLLGGDRAERRRLLLARAAAAVDEVVKFLPDGADRVPDAAFWTAEGRAARTRLADRFTRAALEQERATRWSQVS